MTLKAGRGQLSKYMPFAFTEQGAAMLSGILNSDKAINMNIAIMRAFVEVRRILLKQSDLVIEFVLVPLVRDLLPSKRTHL